MNITDRTTHDVQQGTGDWLRLREGFDTASEAPAAQGVSRYVTRAELLGSQVNVGNVLMLRGAWNDELTEEMRMFPNGVHDDQIDALSRAFEALMHGTGVYGTMSPAGL